MKSILKSFLILILWLSRYAQNLNSKISIMKTEKPILIKDSIIGSANLWNKISSDKIFELSIFKERKQGTTHLFTRKEKNPRIITTTTNHEFRVKSQKELNIIFGLNAENDIYICKYLIKNKKAKNIDKKHSRNWIHKS